MQVRQQGISKGAPLPHGSRIPRQSSASTPKGLRNKAQGCEERAALGKRPRSSSTLKGLSRARVTSTEPELLEYRHNPVGVDFEFDPYPRVARSSQPWAGGRSPVGAGNSRVRHPRNPQSSILNPQSPAFTLIELLVVIGIIAILASILLPVIARGSMIAKKKAAKVEMKLLEAAIISYEATYSHFPAKATGATDLTFGYANGQTGVPANSEVMIILMDIPVGVNANHVMNRGGLTPYSPRRVSDTNSPGFSIVDNQLRDPWGHPYVITMDLDGDRRCRDAFYSTTVSQIQPGQKLGYNGLMDYGTGLFELDAPVMIWSLGPDGKYDDSPTAKANAGANQDNIPSWQ